MTYAQVPKMELHCHLDGAIDPSMLREMQRRGVQVPVSPEALEAAYPVQSFDDFLRWFGVVRPFYADLEFFKPILTIHLERLKAQNVVYSEIMIPSSLMPRDRDELIGKFGEFRNGANQWEGEEIRVEFIIAFGRNKTPEAVEELADRILLLHEANLIVGVALAGAPEQGCPVKPFRKTWQRLREAGIGIEIHAGEWGGPESVWDALENGFPHRIGHGVALFRDPRLVKRFQEERIHVEMCPTSNVKTGSVGCIEEHPVRLARELGLNFSINTDDPGAFECSMESEYQLLTQTFGFEEEDFKRVGENTFNARFGMKA